MINRIKRFWEKESLKHDRAQIDKIFSSYSGVRREEEMRRVIAVFYPRRNLHRNPPKKLRGPDWKRVKYPTGNTE